MNPELPSTPREELEAKLSALLLGELEAVEAAALREVIARDPALARLHDELRQTIALVRAASAQSEEPLPGITALPKLSDAKRMRLLEQLRGNSGVASNDATDGAPAATDPEAGAESGEPTQVIPVRFPESPNVVPLPRRRAPVWLALAAVLVALLAASAFILDHSVRSRTVATDYARLVGQNTLRGASAGSQWNFQPGAPVSAGQAPTVGGVAGPLVEAWSAGTLEADSVQRATAQTDNQARALREAERVVSTTLNDSVAPHNGPLGGVSEATRPAANQSVVYRNSPAPRQDGQAIPALQPELMRRYGLAPARGRDAGRPAESAKPASGPTDRGLIADLYAKADPSPGFANGQLSAAPEVMFNTLPVPTTSTTQGLGQRDERPKRNILAGFFDALPVDEAIATPAGPGSQAPPAPAATAAVAAKAKDQSQASFFGVSPVGGPAPTSAPDSTKAGDFVAAPAAPASLPTPIPIASEAANSEGVVALAGTDIAGDKLGFAYRLGDGPVGGTAKPSGSSAGSAGAPGAAGAANALNTVNTPRFEELSSRNPASDTRLGLGRGIVEQEALAKPPAVGGMGGGGGGGFEVNGRFRGGALAGAGGDRSALAGLARQDGESLTQEDSDLPGQPGSTRELAEQRKTSPGLRTLAVAEEENRAAPSTVSRSRQRASTSALGKRDSGGAKEAQDKKDAADNMTLSDESILGTRFKASKLATEGTFSKRASDRLEAQVAEVKAKAEVAAVDRFVEQVEAKIAAPAPRPVMAPVPQPDVVTAENAFSTFSLNVADVSYKLAAATLEKGALPEPASIRSEEFINAFRYRDPEPAPGVPFSFAWERAQYPFAHHRDVVRLSLRTAARGREAGRPLNLVLVLDSSGSMERADRVRIIREALRVLAGQLRAEDRVSVVSFARTARLWVDALPGDRAAELVERVGQITPEGGTNLEDALRVAYEAALKHFLPDGVNRVILLTDGAANLGDVTPESLQRNVESYRQRGVALDCFGIGWEGLNDDLLEILSRHGDGRYGFLNTPEDAATGFVDQLAGALQVAASDVKVQIEWNPRRVSAWRQIGYARHQLKKEQFRDNTVDAAELGAAESGTALYVIESLPQGDGPVGTVRVRSKDPVTGTYREHEWTLPYTGPSAALEQASPALRLATVAAAFSESLAGSPFAAEVSSDRLLGLLQGVPAAFEPDPRPGRLEWMIRQTKAIRGN